MSSHPEASIARVLLDNAALDALAASANVQTLDQLIPAFRAAPLEGPCYDEPEQASASSFLHKGKKLFMGERQRIVTAVQQFITENGGCNGWGDADVEHGSILKFTAAQRGNRDTVHSVAHTRSGKASYYVTVHKPLGSGRFSVHMAEVQYFMKVTDLAGGRLPLRLAMCKVFSEQQNAQVRKQQQADLRAKQRQQPRYGDRLLN